MAQSRPALTSDQDQPDPLSVQLTLKATDLQVRDALQRIKQYTTDWKLSEDACINVEIVLAEALNNVVEHAYAGIPDGIITIDCAFDGEGMSIVISDQGHPVPEAVFMRHHSRLHAVNTSELPEGGFGWGLIHELTHELKVSRIGKTTLLSLTIITD
jgi:serine/threonine-protein kinase RsbW